MTVPSSQVLRYAAFSDTPAGGNPAGVVLDAAGMDDATMQEIAAEVGYSETAFITGADPTPGVPTRIRYFSPAAEVAFCGHATIATGVALGATRSTGSYPLITNAGPVRLEVGGSGDAIVAMLESPPATALPITPDALEQLLATLGWARADLHTSFAPMIGFAGNRHPILVAHDLSRLAGLEYNFAELQKLCRQQDWTTIQLITPTNAGHWRARDPFPVGGVVEDPATGAAAAAFGGYLRATGHARPKDRFVIGQGIEMGRPSRIDVQILDSTVIVSGTAAPLGHHA